MANSARQLLVEPHESILRRLEVLEATVQKPQFWGCREVENFLRITAPTRIRLIRTGRLIPKRIGRKAFYDREAVMAFFETYRKGAHSA